MKLNKEQYKAAVHTKGPMLVLAGPGSGKTHLLVERIRMMIEEKGIDPATILVITFSKKAARQMQSRFERRTEDKRYPVTFGTFHAVFYHILLEYDQTIGRLVTEQEQTEFAKQIRAHHDIFEEDTLPEEITGLISSYKNLGEDFFARNEKGMMMNEKEREEFIGIVSEYDNLCRGKKVIDFDDMIILCDRILRKHEMLLKKWQSRYRYFLVDEFQDINDSQYDILRLLAGDAMNVFAVGDDDQSIYAFRGARPMLMKKFLKQFRGCRQITLTMNYRCCANVIGAADTLIRHNTERLSRPMQEHLETNAGGTVITVHSENTVVQAHYVCDTIAKVMETWGYAANDIAVLYRSDHCATMFAKVAEEKGFLLRMAGGERFAKAKRRHEAYLRAKAGTATRADWFMIMNDPPRDLSREALAGVDNKFMDAFKRYYENDELMLERIYDLERSVKEYNKDMPEIISPDPKDMINVMTAHASKGLEFKCVFILGLQEGLFPHCRSMTGTLAEEERRLMYVAMTRAKERLYLCSLGTKHGKRSSRFVSECTQNREYITDMLYLTRL